MFRYLWKAFWARPDAPLLNLLPWNALAVAAAGVAGFWDPAIWGVGSAMELIYLITMSSHPGFQYWLNTERLRELQSDTDAARHAALRNLGGAAKSRYKKLEEKRERVEKLYHDLAADDFLIDNNRNALRELTWLFLRLLNAQRNLLMLGPTKNLGEMQRQIAALESELARELPSSALQQSKQATLELMRERVDNLGRRDESLAEIEADLARIESQIDLALEEASLRGRPTAISAKVALVSNLIDDAIPPMRESDSSSSTTTTSAREPER
jgi:hypothetical protein